MEAIVRDFVDGVYSDGFDGGQQCGVGLNSRNGGDMVVIPIVVAAALMVVPAVAVAVVVAITIGGDWTCRVDSSVCVRTRVFIAVKKIYGVAYQ